ncbi:universal stress protein [Solirubrobacter soli]|uniref:universal stress protein n=1 Tax=Solirubrobacter soli TaxID=363832 RepID=UPI00040A0B28|nr:universal stress protein [Solirubrobacter soli]
MERQDHTHHAPVIAAFSPDTGAREPVEFGVAASRITGAPLIIVVVADTGAVRAHFGAEQEAKLPGGIADTVKHLELDLRARGIDVEVRAYEDSTAARGLARAIDECSPELVVIGSTSRGSKGSALLGTTADRIIHVSACPVAVVPHGYRRPEGGVALIGAAYTESQEGEDALAFAEELARIGGVRLRAITVIDPKHAAVETGGMMTELHHEVSTDVREARKGRVSIEAKLRERLARTPDADIDILANEPEDGLVAASAHVDLLVLGSRARGPRRSVVLGSVSRKVIERAACPVVVIPRGSEDKSGELLADAAGQTPTS